MKKLYQYIIWSIVIIGLSACGKNNETDTIEECVASYLNEDFEYYKTIHYFDTEGKSGHMILKGTYVANPYQETIEVVEGKDDNSWEKAIYAGEGEVVTTKLYAEAEWTETTAKREYPYGYGEELTFELVGEESIDDILCEVYTTWYTVELGNNVFVDDKILATVSQIYYMEKETGVLVGIDTDLKDLNEKTYIYNDILANGKTLAEAKENAEIVGNFSKTEEMRIIYN